ncbi:MAG: HAD-IA family hydrolase, partial [Arcobacteraceae bacterium]
INDETISYIQSIKDKSILALLSNMTFDTLQEIGNMYWLDYFNLKIFSCEKKVAKPHPRIYEICLEDLNMNPQQILFVDDSTENIIAAQKMGINTIKFTNCHEIREIIENEYIFIR